MCFGFHGENFSMKWIELRSMCYKNICALDANQIAEALRIVKKNSAESGCDHLEVMGQTGKCFQ
jgi:hypothetical protein